MEKHTKLLDIIKKEYKIERFDDLQQKELEKIRWTRVKERNFYTVLKILAENKPLTIAEIIKLDPFHRERNRNSSIQAYLRRFNGGEKDNVTGLIEKNIIVKIENEHEYRDRYRLTLYGVFLAIEFFCNEKEITMSINSSEKSTEILDLIAENYHDYLSMIFAKWNVLKLIHPSIASLIKTIMHPEPKIQNGMRTLADIHLFTKRFDSDEKQITGMFYYDFIQNYVAWFSQEQKSKLGKDMIQYMENIIEITKDRIEEEKLYMCGLEARIKGASINQISRRDGKITNSEKKLQLKQKERKQKEKLEEEKKVSSFWINPV